MKYKCGKYKEKAQSDYEQMVQNKQFDFFPYIPTCTHAQQYAEKMAKEKLVELGINPDHIHKITVLLTELSNLTQIDVPARLIEGAAKLDIYYFSTRYPSENMIIVGQETAEEAFTISVEIVEWIESLH